MKTTLILIFSFLYLTSCSHIENTPDREIASTPKSDCRELVSNILSSNFKQKVIYNADKAPQKKMTIQELQERGVLKFREKVYTYNLPPVDWFNKIRHDLISRMKTWNNNRYPIFYLSKDKNYQEKAKNIPELDEQLHHLVQQHLGLWVLFQ